MKTFTLLTDTEIAAMRAPITEARTFPPRAFTSEEFFTYESRSVLSRSWMAIGFGCELPNSGDARPVTVLGEPVLIVRAPDGAVRAFHNICPYDGCEVLLNPASALEEFVTPYHGWRYGLDGRLKQAGYWDGMPAGATAEQIQHATDLQSVAVAEWFGVIFVRLHADGRSFADHIAPVEQHLSTFELGQHVVGLTSDGVPAINRLSVQANWKTMYENYAPNVYHESYVHAMYRKSPHSPRVNPDGEKTYNEIIEPDGFIGLSYKNNIAGSFYPESPFRAVRSKSGSPADTNLIANGFPNWAITVLNNFARMSFWHPVSAGYCEQQIATYFVAEEASDPSLAAERAHAARGGVIAREEDNLICESIQRARRSRAAAANFYSPFWDKPHYALNNLLLDKILAGDIHG